MGIQSFTPSSGGVPGLDYINQVVLTTANRIWNQGGGAGTYTIKSARNEPGYVYFIGNVTVGGPLNGIVEVSAPFTSIKIIGSSGDLVSLYKVAAKATNAFSTTANITYITASTQSLSVPTNQTGFIDAILVAGGGGRNQHGGGGGGGGIVILNSFPLTPGVLSPVVIGARGADRGNGGDTIFAGIKAVGGGFGASSNSSFDGNNGGNAGGGQNGYAGKSTQGTGTGAVASPILFFSAYGTTASAQGIGFDSTPPGGSDHQGGGGAGGGGSNNGVNGGPGYLLSWDNTRYSAGGRGSRHASQFNGENGTGWSASGYGMGGESAYGAVNGQLPTAGIVIVRSYSI
jgi:hypothetical protein